ncbi:MAG TPA: hypothetical protein DF383_06505 [Deltaproteobacteria bacterium]|nr:hypothetical protein [Deltaproteobacteria bacterium]
MAVPAKTISEEISNPYMVSKALFDSASAVKDKMKLIEGRLEKMEAHRNEVSESVYYKVKTDYEAQLDEIRRNFEEKSREIERELGQLYQARAEQEQALATHQEILEEAKFRHKLGEYIDKKFKDVEAQQNKEIKKYNDLLDIIKGSIKQYETVLGQAYRAGATAAAAVSTSKPKTAPREETQKTALTPVPEPAPAPRPTAAETVAVGEMNFEEKFSDELDVFLDTEGEYFSAAAEPLPEPTPLSSSPKAEKSEPPAVSQTAPVNDSISTILRDIPFESVEPAEEQSSEGVTKVAAEESGARIDLREVLPEASMLLIEGELEESEFILGESTSIGRSPSNDIVLKETKVSRQHAAINLHNGNYVLVDLKSSNGVFVNGKKVEEATLQDGDQISIGSFKFQFNLA